MPSATPAKSSDFKIMVCGSHRFQDRTFVWNLLDGIKHGFPVSSVMAGPFAGADEHARSWAESHGLPYAPVDFNQNDFVPHSFVDERPFPEAVIKRDPRLGAVAKRLSALGPRMILAIPRPYPEGGLGPTTSWVSMAADKAGIPVLRADEALLKVARFMEQALEQTAMSAGAQTLRASAMKA